ncbi:hypothetical protein [Embleya sp. NPDC059259]|uniref:hypothetical protein n=1 Tax=unclassified Embleya TaxID=2699296 RepID=UPI003689A396
MAAPVNLGENIAITPEMAARQYKTAERGAAARFFAPGGATARSTCVRTRDVGALTSGAAASAIALGAMHDIREVPPRVALLYRAWVSVAEAPDRIAFGAPAAFDSPGPADLAMGRGSNSARCQGDSSKSVRSGDVSAGIPVTGRQKTVGRSIG